MRLSGKSPQYVYEKTKIVDSEINNEVFAKIGQLDFRLFINLVTKMFPTLTVCRLCYVTLTVLQITRKTVLVMQILFLFYT